MKKTRTHSKRLAELRREVRRLERAETAARRSAVGKRVAREIAQRNSMARARAVGIGRFRPRAEDRGGLVFLNSKGKRVESPSGRAKYTVLSVGKRGAVRVIGRDGKVRPVQATIRAGKFGAQKVRDLKPYRAKGAARAVRQVLESMPRALVSEKVKTPAPSRADQGVSPWGALGGVAEDLARNVVLAGGGRGAEMLVTVSFSFRVGGRLHTKETSGIFRVGKVDQKTLERLCRDWCRSVLYAGIAEGIGAENGVTSGSARFIRRLPENKGRKRGALTKRKGSGDAYQVDKWGKGQYGRAVVESFSWKIERAV